MKMRIISDRRWLSPKYTEPCRFTLLFCSGRPWYTKIYNARAGLLFCSLNLSFSSVLAAVAIVLSLFPPSWPTGLFYWLPSYNNNAHNNNNNNVVLFTSPSWMFTYLSPALGSRNRAGVTGNLVRKKHTNLKKILCSSLFLEFYIKIPAKKNTYVKQFLNLTGKLWESIWQ